MAEKFKEPSYYKFLERFLTPYDINNLPNYSYFIDKKKLITELIRDELLESCSLHETALQILDTATIKTLLKARGSKVSGKKEELVKRLIEKDKPYLEDVFKHNQVVKCSSKAISVLEQFHIAKKQAEKQSIKECFEALYRKDFETTGQIYAQYLSAFSADRRYLLETPEKISKLFTLVPYALENISGEHVHLLRVLAALYYIWSGNFTNTRSTFSDVDKQFSYSDYIPDTFPFSSEKTTMMCNYLLRNLEISESLAYMRSFIRNPSIELRVMIHFKSPNAGSCEYCSKFSDQIILEKEISHFPHRDCYSEVGCQFQMFSHYTHIESISYTLLEILENRVSDDEFDEIVSKASSLKFEVYYNIIDKFNNNQIDLNDLLKLLKS